MNNKLQAKDLINIGLFTVLYFVLGCCVAIPIGFVPIFLPILGALWTLITGIPFMLFAVRVKKFGMVTIMAVLSGILMGLTGMGFWGVPMGVVFGLLGDLIMKSGNYASAKKTLLGYGVFSLWMVGTYIPMYFMVEQSRADFAAGFGEEYADKVMSVMPTWSIVLVIAVFHRPSVSSSTKGSTLNTGLTIFITPLLPVDSISDVTVISISSLVRGSRRRPRRFAVQVRASIRRYRP